MDVENSDDEHLDLKSSEESSDGLNQPIPQPGPSNATQESQDRGAQSSLRQQQESKELSEEPSLHSTSTGKDFFHGNVYQLRLLMLYLHRGLKKEYSFRLATEMLAAGKFDDVVFRYQSKDEDVSNVSHKKIDDENKEATVNDSPTKKNTRVHRFLQAEHQQQDSTVITSEDLLSDAKKKAFSLQKYFNSYLDIKMNPEFNVGNDIIKDLTICTNMGLDTDFKNEYFVPLLNNDILVDLEVTNAIVEPKRFKLKQKFFDDNSLAATLKDGSDINLLTTKLTEHIMSTDEEVTLSLKDPLFGKYHLALAEHVIAIGNCSGQFRDEFTNKNLAETGEVGNFRKALLEKSDLSEDDFKKQLKTKKFDTTVRFGKKDVSKDEYCFDWLTRLPHEVTDKEIIDFSEKLIFAVNQPNVDELGEIIKREIGEQFNLRDSEFIVASFQKYMLDWMKHKEGRFLTHTEGETYFKDVSQKFSQHKLIGVTTEYCTRIDSFGITFSEVPSELRDFLNSNDEQIFNLVCSDSTTSGSIKVQQALKETHKEDDSKICLHLSSLLLLQKYVIEAFTSTEADHLLVIECDAVVGDIHGIYIELSDILKNAKCCDKKKVIFITQENDALAKKFENEFHSRFKKKSDKRNSFSNLTQESQVTLLGNREIIFQEEKTSLGKLMEITDVNNLSEKELYHLNKIIDPKALVQLIKNEDSIEVGIKQPDLTDLDSIYYIASATITIADFSSAVENNSSDLFFIGGTTKEKFSAKYKEEVAMRALGEGVASEKDRIIILDDKDEEKNLADFKRTCCEYINIKGEDICAHLIEKKNDTFNWKRSYDQSFYIKRYLYHVEIKKDFLRTFIAEEPEEGREKKDIFAISSIEGSEFGIEISKSENISTGDDCSKKNHIIELKDVIEETCFEELCSDEWLTYYNIHWLQNKDNKLLWRRSEGEMNKIQKLKAPNAKLAITDNLNDITGTGQPVVIAGEPGMGKSTALMQFIKQLDASEWIIKLNLINLEEQLKKLSGVHDLDGFIETFFSKIGVGVANNLTRQLLKYRIEHQGKITLFFDGFDEVADENQEAVIQLLKHLKNTQVKILITTRLSVKDKLENALSVFSYTFQPFSEGNQEAFLQKFWKASFKLKRGKMVNNSTFDNNFRALFQRLYIKVKKNELMSIPVSIRIFAEIYQEIVEKSCYSGSQVEFEGDFSEMDLYKKFIERKFAIYFREKRKIESIPDYEKKSLIKSLNKDHQHLALNKLFPKLEHTNILIDSLPSQDDVRYLKRVGIIQSTHSKGDLQFIHQSLAEYFAAGLLFNRIEGREDGLKYKEVRMFLLTQIFRNRNKAIRDFLDKMILTEGKTESKNEWEKIQDCDLFRRKSIETSLLYFVPSPVEGSNIQTVAQHDAASVKSLLELKKDVESCMTWIDDKYLYKGDVKLITKLFAKFLKEKEFEILNTTFKFIVKANGNSHYLYANEAFSRNDNFYNATKHYLSQAKQEECVSDAFTSLIPNFETFKRNLTKFNSSTDTSTEEVKKKKYANEVRCFLQDSGKRTLLCFFIKNFYPGFIKYISPDIEKLFNDVDFRFLEREGIKTVMDYEILTPQMTEQFCSKLDNPLVGYRITGFDRLYTQVILNSFVIPIVERMKKENLSYINRLAFLKMLVCFTHFLVERTSTRYSFTTEQLGTVLEEFKKLLEEGEHVHMALCQITEYLLMLAKAGLKVITLNDEKQLLVLDPASEFQCEILSRTEQIVELIKWKLQNPDATRNAFLQECYKVEEPTKTGLKRKRSD